VSAARGPENRPNAAEARATDPGGERGGAVTGAPSEVETRTALPPVEGEGANLLQEPGSPPVFAPVFGDGELVAGRFRIERFLGQGGMGQVFAAFDLELGESVALKTLRPEQADNPRLLAAFKREVGLARQVTHPNVCRLFDLFTLPATESRPRPVSFVTMELLEGASLRDLLARRGRLNEEEALDLGRQIAAALDAAHGVGVVHRDLKPGNVILAQGAAGVRAVVCDFGLAASDPLRSSPSRTAGAELRGGTAGYLAPEQMQGGEVTPALDLYAFGVVLHRMLTGRLPGAGDSAGRTELPAGWAGPIERCLERDPAKRPRSAGKVIRQIEARRGPGRLGRRTMVATVVAAMVVAGAAWGLWQLAHRGTAGTADAGALDPAMADRPSIAVLDFVETGGRTEDAWLGVALAEMLSVRLASGEQLASLPRGFLRGLGVTSQATGGSLDDSLAAASRSYRSFGLRWWVVGSYERGAEGTEPLAIEVSLLDGESGEVAASLRTAGAVSGLETLASDLAASLRSRLGVAPPSPREMAMLAATQPTDLATYRLYSEALAAIDRDDQRTARELLERAIEREPDYPFTRSALADVLSFQGYETAAAEQAEEALRSAGDVSREERLTLEARAHGFARRWDQAADRWKALWTFFPDRVDYALELARAQRESGDLDAALDTIAIARRQVDEAAEDPRLDLAEAEVYVWSGDVAAELELANAAKTKAEAGGGRALVVEALLLQGDALERMAEPAAADEAYLEAIRLAESYDNPRLRGEALLALSSLRLDRGEPGEAEEAARQALALFQQLGHRGNEGRALDLLGIVLSYQGDLASGAALSGRAAGVFREVGDTRKLSSALSNRGMCEIAAGQLGAAEASYTEALALARAAGSKEALAAALNNLSEVYLRRGRLGQARQVQEEALGLTREMGHRIGEIFVTVNLALIDLEELDLVGAKVKLDAIRDEAEQPGLETLQFAVAEGFARIEMVGDHLEKARELIEPLLAAEGAGVDPLRVALVQARAELALAEGDPGTAALWARRGLAVASDSGLRPYDNLARALLVRAHAADGTPELVLDQARALERFVAETEYLSARGAAILALAELDAARGLPERAASRLSALLAATDPHLSPRLELEVRLALARIEVAGGATRRQGLERARALAERGSEAGHDLIARQARQLLVGV